MFENQGFAGSIDFTGLTEELKESIVDRAYEYYHSLDTQREEIKFEQYLEGLNKTAKADAAPQKKAGSGDRIRGVPYDRCVLCGNAEPRG